jgi:hypothetical protein
VPPSVKLSETVNVYEPFARPLYDSPDRDPFAPAATGASQGPVEDVGPSSVQTSVRVAFGFLL